MIFAVEKLGDLEVLGTFIRFIRGASKTGKTAIWLVLDRQGAEIGEVKWYGAWRRYAFFPVDSIYEEKCLREIVDFIEVQTKERRRIHSRPRSAVGTP